MWFYWGGFFDTINFNHIFKFWLKFFWRFSIEFQFIIYLFFGWSLTLYPEAIDFDFTIVIMSISCVHVGIYSSLELVFGLGSIFHWEVHLLTWTFCWVTPSLFHVQRFGSTFSNFLFTNFYFNITPPRFYCIFWGFKMVEI